MSAVDPITRQVIRNALRAAAAEMQTSLVQTAHSPLICEVQDFGVAITDADGRLVGEGSAMVGFLGCLPPTVQSGIRLFGKDGFSEGDVVLANDPYDTGTHISDTVVYAPIFFEGELVAFTAIMAHWADIGGFAPGGWCATTTDVHQEGLLLDHVKLYDAGKLNRDLHRLILKNVRTPAAVDGDLNGLMAACNTGGRRFQDLCERYGVATIRRALDEIIGASESRMRREIVAMPDGTFHAEAFLDHDGINRGQRCRIAVAVTVKGDRMCIDFAGSDPATKGPVNNPFVGTRALCAIVLKALTMPDDATNDGHIGVVDVIAPHNSIVSPVYPAPCDSYGYVADLVQYVVLRALADAMPDRIPAPGYPMLSYHLYRTAAGAGSTFICAEPVDGGGGALPHDDGPSGIMFFGNGDTPNAPIEVLEATYPVRFERYTFNPVNRGTGEYRGGYGVVREFRMTEDGAELTISTENSDNPLLGLRGGGNAGASVTIVREADGRETAYTDRAAAIGPLKAGAVISIQTANGAGWGDPARRDPARIAADVRNEMLTIDEAVADYGVPRAAIEAALRDLAGRAA